MQQQQEKIRRFSKMVYVFLRVLAVIFIVLIVLEAGAWIWHLAQLHSETVMINGQSYQAPLLFKLGEGKVMLPLIWQSGFDYSGIAHYGKLISYLDLVGSIITLLSVRYALKVFKLLKTNGNPFGEDVVKSLKKLAIVLFITGGVSGAVPLLAGGIVWVLTLVFDYGRLLQEQSDTTL